MRLFFAADIPDEQRALLVGIQDRLKPIHSDVKWVEPQNIHITLRFLGEVNGKILPELEKIGREVGKLYGSYDISLSGLGTFPPKGPPRVLWVGIDSGKAQTSMLAQAIDSRLAKLNIKMEEHEFKPHITLGRLKSSRVPEALLAAMNADSPQFAPWHFDSFELKESRLTRTGPIYKCARKFTLASKDRVIVGDRLRGQDDLRKRLAISRVLPPRTRQK